MQKSVLALSLAAALSVVSFSANAALENSWTIGVRGGWAHLFADDYNYEGYVADATEEDGYGVGLYGEYSFTSWFALGIGFTYFDGFEGGIDDLDYHVDASQYGPEIYGRFSYTFDDKGSDIFARVGVSYIFTDLDGLDDEDQFVPLIGIGAQYNFTRNFGLRVGYDYYFQTYDENVETDLGFLYLGLQLTFGGPTPVAAAAAPAVERVSETHTLDAGILFPFDGSVLTEEGQAAVGTIVEDSARLQNAEFEVYGYTDRIGSEEYNLDLSQRRADAVSEELYSQGVVSKISEGRGEADPVTGDKCDSLRNKQELIDCLAPDRRVEVVVSGEIVKEQQL